MTVPGGVYVRLLTCQEPVSWCTEPILRCGRRSAAAWSCGIAWVAQGGCHCDAEAARGLWPCGLEGTLVRATGAPACCYLAPVRFVWMDLEQRGDWKAFGLDLCDRGPGSVMFVKGPVLRAVVVCREFVRVYACDYAQLLFGLH